MWSVEPAEVPVMGLSWRSDGRGTVSYAVMSWLSASVAITIILFLLLHHHFFCSIFPLFLVFLLLLLLPPVLAVGYSSGSVVLLDAEDGHCLHEVCVDGGVTCLHWVQEQNTAATEQQKGERLPWQQPGCTIVFPTPKNVIQT